MSVAAPWIRRVPDQHLSMASPKVHRRSHHIAFPISHIHSSPTASTPVTVTLQQSYKCKVLLMKTIVDLVWSFHHIPCLMLLLKIVSSVLFTLPHNFFIMFKKNHWPSTFPSLPSFFFHIEFYLSLISLWAQLLYAIHFQTNIFLISIWSLVKCLLVTLLES